jgi:cyclophilin family peptidyl-prolyl cis-trans isomerase
VRRRSRESAQRERALTRPRPSRGHLQAPRAAENFRAMSTGEKGKGWTFVGMRFYRILDLFIDQAGAGPGSVWSGSFDDDPGGLALHHDRPGLLSAANSGPDTNSGHFSIVVAPAPHLDASYTIFGEVVSGMDVVMAINRLDKYVKGSATVQEAGCVSNCASLGVEPKCKHRAATSRNVQNRPMKPCVD